VREIKFRGKRVDNGEWIYGNLVVLDDDYYIIPQTKPYRDTPFESYRWGWLDQRVDPETVGQFTDLLDVDGAEIYEGDVVQCEYVSYVQKGIVRYPKTERIWTATVEYDKVNPCFVLVDIANKDHLEYDFVICDLLRLKRVGNRYDNPELLEVGNE